MIFIFEGDPIPQARPRIVKAGTFTKTYNPNAREKKNCQKEILSQLSGYPKEATSFPLQGAICVSLAFHMHYPSNCTKSKKKAIEEGLMFPASRPDIDNLIKFILDCGNELIWKDDSQIVRLEAFKVYSTNPRTEMYIKPYEYLAYKHGKAIC